MARISNPKSFAGNKPLATVFEVESMLKGPTNALGSYGYVPLNAENKISASYIPQVSITDTFVGNSEEVTAAGSFQAFVNSLVTTGKIPSGGDAVIKAEKGDLVKITDGESQGSYIITNVVNGVGSWLMLNTSLGTVMNVNGQTGPNVVLNLSDINDVNATLATLVKSMKVQANATDLVERVLISEKELALLTDVQTKMTRVTSAVTGNIPTFATNGEVQDSGVKIGGNAVDSTTSFTSVTVASATTSDASGSYTQGVNNNTWTYTGSDDTYTATYAGGVWTVTGDTSNVAVADAVVNAVTTTIYKGDIVATEKAVGALYETEMARAKAAEQTLTGSIAAERNRALGAEGELAGDITDNKTAIEKSIELTTTTFTWAEADSTVISNVKRYSKVVSGRVIQVFDANGEWCYPSVSYNSTTNESTISVDMETTDTLAELWTICVANKVVVIPSNSSSSSTSSSSSSSN